MALMILIIIAHHADIDTGIARITYDMLEDITDKSRLKISKGLKSLLDHNLLENKTEGRSTFKLLNYRRDRGWAALPAKLLYDKSGCIEMFKGFTLRSPTELVALKIYLLLAAYRDSETNSTSIGFDKIAQLTGSERSHIRLAKSYLIGRSLIHVDPAKINNEPAYFTYRLFGLYPRKHGGSTGRSDGISSTSSES